MLSLHNTLIKCCPFTVQLCLSVCLSMNNHIMLQPTSVLATHHKVQKMLCNYNHTKRNDESKKYKATQNLDTQAACYMQGGPHAENLKWENCFQGKSLSDVTTDNPSKLWTRRHEEVVSLARSFSGLSGKKIFGFWWRYCNNTFRVVATRFFRFCLQPPLGNRKCFFVETERRDVTKRKTGPLPL